MMMGGIVLPQINLTISTDQTSYNIKTQAGNPAAASLIVLTVNTGIKARNMVSGALVAGTKIRIVNNGCIYGQGGTGGTGGNAQEGVSNPGTSGSVGNAAIDLQAGSLALEIDNTNGYVLGGGAGGHGGASFYAAFGNTGGGGGGGGAGGGTYGNGGTIGTGSVAPANGVASYQPHWSGSIWDQGFPSQSMEVGTGGAGGHDFYGDGAAGLSGTAYGASGKAVNLNGNPITWLGGNNSTQVKGAVS